MNVSSTMSLRVLPTLAVLGILAAPTTSIVAAERSQVTLPTGEQVAAKPAMRAGVVFSSTSVAHALLQHTAPWTWSPAVNTLKLRGAAQYAEIAPAVVVVRTQIAHGTGFFVRSNGVLITNNHVIAKGLWQDDHGSYAMIHTGKLGTDGVMHLDPEPVRAHVLKHDAAKDLAILRLDAPPSEPTRQVKLAESSPRPGMQIAIIGHPSSGMLWTYRSGEISAIGYSPKDMVNVLMPMLAASKANQESARQFLSQSDSEKILLTSAVANPGDSGGPVVNSDNKLIAITFAVPAAVGEKAFSYHIHVDEVRKFLADIPTSTTFVIPDMWDIGPQIRLLDLDGDGKPDVLVSGTSDAEELMFDLSNQTSTLLTQADHLGGLIEQQSWHCDFAIRLTDRVAFYDRDGDGQIDMIVQGSANTPTLADSRFVLAEGRWWYESYHGNLIDPMYLGDSVRAQRLSTLLAAMSK